MPCCCSHVRNFDGYQAILAAGGKHRGPPVGTTVTTVELDGATRVDDDGYYITGLIVVRWSPTRGGGRSSQWPRAAVILPRLNNP